MANAPPAREAGAGVVAARSAAVEMAQGEGVSHGGREAPPQRARREVGGDRAPEPAGGHAHGDDGPQRRSAGEARHHAPRDGGVERAGARASAAVRPVRQSQGQHRRERGRDHERRAEGRATEGRAEPARPDVLRIGLPANARKRRRDVDGEGMRRRILARVPAGAAVVAEIGEMAEVRGRKGALAGKGREDGAEPVAVHAGAADAQDALRLARNAIRGHGLPPPLQRVAPTRPTA